MLTHLTVENYILIDRLDLDFERGLNTLTGQTGAGKSILLGALGLLLGDRSEGSEAVRDPARNCVVEGRFCIDGYGLEPLFEQYDLEWSETITIRRVLTPTGRSRAYVGDLPVTLQPLRDLGQRLVDIHSQYQNLRLADEGFRLRAVDALADDASLRAAYERAYTELVRLRRRLEELRQEAAAGRKDEEWLRFQVEEFEAAALCPGEQAEAETEQQELAHADAIRQAMQQTRSALEEEGVGVLERIHASRRALEGVAGVSGRAAELASRLASSAIELLDVAAETAREADRVEADPERLQRVEARLALIYELQRKHRVRTLDELLALQASYAERLAAIEHNDAALDEECRRLREAEQEAWHAGRALHEARVTGAAGIGERVEATLRMLGMSRALFRAEVTPTDELRPTGMDTVHFLFAADRTLAPQPAERIASGGELSRIMLALKELLARSMRLPTLIFDEIDTGVSGSVADAMGGIIWRLSRSMQVLNITHLPQVAAFGRTHFVVRKEADAEGVRTRIERLSPEERIEEIARMLSGSQLTRAAMEQARILLSGGEPE